MVYHKKKTDQFHLLPISSDSSPQNVFGFKGVLHLKRSYFSYFWVKYPFKFKDETHFVSVAVAARSAGEAPPHSSSPLKEKDKQTLS